MKNVLLGLALALGFIANARIDILNAQVTLLETQHQETTVENIFLARKLGELHDENDQRFTKTECQTDLAVAGFRMGHNRAYRMMKTGMFENCNTLQEMYLD